jgi:ribosomal-protein-alanine N-acetyltransferase
MIRNIYNEPFPTLEIDQNFVLREQSLEDTETFLQYYSDPDVHRYILATPPTNLSDAADEIHYCRNLFYQKKGIYWTLAHRKDNRMIGAAGLYINYHHERAEISYDLSKEFWRQGIMGKVLKKLLEYSFSHVGLKRLEAVTLNENMPSQSILSKLGFVHEGMLRNYRYFNGRNHDIEMFGLTPEMYVHGRQAEQEQRVFAEQL